MRKITILALVAVLAGILAAPTVAEAGPASRTSISGTITLTPVDPGETRMTPSGVIHQSGAKALLDYSGDVAGEVTCYYHPNTISADGLFLVFSCSTAGEFTWDGRTGPVSGMLRGQCRADVPFVFFCGGTGTYQGSGDLKGVTFRTTWSGPYSPFVPPPPFTYEGTAVDPHG